MSQFLIGQRVVYSSSEIVTVIRAPHGEQSLRGYQWVDRQAGYPQHVSLDNLKPLPGGQL